MNKVAGTIQWYFLVLFLCSHYRIHKRGITCWKANEKIDALEMFQVSVLLHLIQPIVQPARANGTAFILFYFLRMCENGNICHRFCSDLATCPLHSAAQTTLKGKTDILLNNFIGTTSCILLLIYRITLLIAFVQYWHYSTRLRFTYLYLCN